MALQDEIKGKRFHFSRADGSFICNLRLNADGSLSGGVSPQEISWQVRNGVLVFCDASGMATTIFKEMKRVGEYYHFQGDFNPSALPLWHKLTEFDSAEVFDLQIFDLIDKSFGKTSDSYTLSKIAALSAGVDSALYVVSNMQDAKAFSEKFSFLSDAMSSRTVEGLILEFGVYNGTTINHIASSTRQEIYGFDVFSGLPENWRPGFPEGAFKLAKLPEVRSNVELVVGLFDDTLGDFLKSHGGPVSLVHVDCDLYSSTKSIFEKIAPRIKVGTIIVFDEYFNYAGWRKHEYKAFQEFIEANHLAYKYISYVDTHQQVAVEIVRSDLR